MNEKMSIEEYLRQNGTLIYSNVGVSMLPLLRQGKDLFVVQEKKTARCKKGDIVLYKRQPDQYVLHRVIKVCKKDYVILGDNCIRKEYGITDKDILGVMTEIIRNGKRHSLNEPVYLFYSFLWTHTAFLRMIIKKTSLLIRMNWKRLP